MLIFLIDCVNLYVYLILYSFNIIAYDLDKYVNL